jgi:FkbM family methyltransferase
MTPALRDRFLVWYLARGWRGFHALHRCTRRFGGSRQIRHRTAYGAVFALDPGSYIDRIVLREGYYESEVLEALRAYLGEGAVLWDIGGNFGLHSITAKVLHPATQVFTFEPNPAMIAEIKTNAALNDVHLTVMSCALAEAAGPRTFHVNDHGNAGMSTLAQWEGGHYDRTITVECMRADLLVASGRVLAPTVIKLDVEGGEPGVLSGLGALLDDAGLRAIVFEACARLETRPDSDPVAGPLRAAGFRFTPLARREHSSHSLDNYLAIRG